MTTTSSAPRRALTLPGGRRLGILEVGDPQGTPCLHFHGTGSSRLEARVFDAAAQAFGVRMIGVERPGVGLSDPHPGATLLGWAADAASVADALGLERIAVSGVSAGGPYALACAHELADRVTVALPVNPATPADVVRAYPPPARALVVAAQRAPWLLRRVLAPLLVSSRASSKGGGDAGRERLLRRLPEVDRGLLADPGRWQQFTENRAEAARQGPAAAAQDMLLFWREPWGFDPLAVAVPVVFFVGEQDLSRPWAERAAAAMPQGEVRTFPGGHYAFVADAVTAAICKAVR